MDYKLEEFNFNFELLRKFLQSRVVELCFTTLQSNILLYCVVLLLALKIITISIPINFPQNIFFADITKSALENFTNQARQSNGLKPLVENQKLEQAAQLKAENMVQNQYFDHTSPSGITPWFWFLKAGYNYKYAGENLAIGFFDSKEVYDAWLNSPSHKDNILNPNYTEVGIAVLNGFGRNNTIVVVQEFGSQQPAKQIAVGNNNTKIQPTVKPIEQTVTKNIGEKVLSQSIESQSAIEAAETGSNSNLYYKIMNSVLYNYDRLLQYVIYGVSSVVIGVLLALIFFNFYPIKRELVFRAVLIMVLLSAATLLNKEIIISFIPHQIII